jgi:hypothetical protein
MQQNTKTMYINTSFISIQKKSAQSFQIQREQKLNFEYLLFIFLFIKIFFSHLNADDLFTIHPVS